MRRNLLLLHPPGWDACVSGPYAAGPYLQGYLRAAGFGCRWVDISLAVANAHTQPITGQEAQAADQAGLDASNDLYFHREGLLRARAAGFAGSWTLREGFQPDDLDFGSSGSVRKHLATPAPYDDWLRQTLSRLVAEERPDFIGLSVAVPYQLFGAFRIATQLRDLAPDIPVVLGGNIPSRLVGQMALPWVFDLVDILSTHQGEETLAALLTAGPDRGSWSSVPNIRYREGEGVRATATRYLDRRLFAQPSYDGIDFDAYWGFPYATIMASRGCYYGKCPFCAIPYTWGEKGFLGHDHPAAVVQTMIDCIDKHGVNRFKFIEESLHPRIVDQLATHLLQAGVGAMWEGYARMDAPWFRPSFLNKAARAGLRKLYVGLELIDSDGRDLLGKKDRPAASEFLRAQADAGILVHLFVLVGHPGTGLDEAMRTIDFVLAHEHLIDTIEINGFRYEKHTTIADVLRRPDPARDWSMDDPYTSTLTPTLTPGAVNLLEEQLYWGFGSKAPRWTHALHQMVSPWAIPWKAHAGQAALAT